MRNQTASQQPAIRMDDRLPGRVRPRLLEQDQPHDRHVAITDLLGKDDVDHVDDALGHNIAERRAIASANWLPTKPIARNPTAPFVILFFSSYQSPIARLANALYDDTGRAELNNHNPNANLRPHNCFRSFWKRRANNIAGDRSMALGVGAGPVAGTAR
jgi:hypothetical protein